MFILLLAQIAQTGVVTNVMHPPPPVMVAIEPSPPAIVAVPSAPGKPTTVVVPANPSKPVTTASVRDSLFPPLPPAIVTVRIYAGKRLLLTDKLRVRRYNATALLQRYEAPADECPPGSSPTAQSSLTFQINREASKSPDEFFIGLTWNRPLNECRIEGSRGVSMAQSVIIKPGKTTVVNGDGGVRIEFSRP
jgi:hypothetical protein